MNRLVLPAALFAALSAAPFALATPDGDAGASPCAPPPAQGAPAPAAENAFDVVHARSHARMRARMRARHAARFLRMLGLTDAQRADFRQARIAAATIRADLRAKIRATILEARKGERTDATRAATREKVKALVTAAREQVAPDARRLLGTITPEQRARLSEAAARHGKTLDDATLLRRIESLLVRPGFGRRGLGRGPGRHAGN